VGGGRVDVGFKQGAQRRPYRVQNPKQRIEGDEGYKFVPKTLLHTGCGRVIQLKKGGGKARGAPKNTRESDPWGEGGGMKIHRLGLKPGRGLASGLGMCVWGCHLAA
jgi:hypothetical protein